MKKNEKSLTDANISMSIGDLFSALTTNTDDLIWSIDRNYNLIYCNEAFRNFSDTYYDEKLKVGASVFSKGLSDKSHEEWKNYYDRAFSTGETYTIEAQTKFIPGNQFIEYAFNPIRSKQGDVNGLLVIGRNITNHVKTREQLTRVNDLLILNEELSKSGSWDWDFENETMRWTDQVYRIFDYTPENFDSSSQKDLYRCLNCFHPEDKEQVRDSFNNCVYKGIAFDREFRVVKEKELKWVQIIGRPVVESGKIIKAKGVIRDITEQKRKDDEIRNSEKKYKTLIEHAAEMLFLHDMHGNIVEVNEAAVKQTGYSRDELLKMSVFDIDPDAVQRLDKTNIWNSLKESAKKSLVVKHRRKDGSEYAAEVVISKVELNQSDYVFALARDITERKKAEDELKSVNVFISSLISSMPDGVSILDVNGIHIDVNPAMCKMTGFSRDELIGFGPPFPYWPPEEEENLKKVFEKTMNGESGNFEMIFMRKNGQRFPVIVSPYAIKDINGKIVNYSATIKETTEFKKIEQQIKLKNQQLQELNASKDKLFSIIAHDLKGPFNVILGTTELISNELHNLTQEQVNLLFVNLNKSAKKLYQLLENLLSWSRFQRGVINFNPIQINLFEHMSSVLEPVMELIRRKNLSLSIDIEEDLKVKVDIRMFESLVRNLVTNAVKFTPRNGKIEIKAVMTGKRMTRISVKDTGIGMSSELIDELFRIDGNSGRPGTEGESSTGLGLLLCKEFVSVHGGDIWVNSAEGKGSEFIFTLNNK